jgi:hypothetical protein
VANAHDSVRAAARAVTTTPGGSGAIREIATWLLGPNLQTSNLQTSNLQTPNLQTLTRPNTPPNTPPSTPTPPNSL